MSNINNINVISQVNVAKASWLKFIAGADDKQERQKPFELSVEYNGTDETITPVSVFFKSDTLTVIITAERGKVTIRQADPVSNLLYSDGDVIQGDEFESGYRSLVASVDDNSTMFTSITMPLKLKPGFTAIFSGPAGGKSVLAKAITASASGHYVTIGEPESHSAGSSLDIYLALAFLRASGAVPVLAVDSLRQLLLRAPGNTRTGGVPTGVVDLFTGLDRVAHAMGIALIGVVNPSTVVNEHDSDNQKLTASHVIRADMRSSTVAQIIIGSASKDASHLKIDATIEYRDEGRQGEGFTARVMYTGMNDVDTRDVPSGFGSSDILSILP